MKVAEGQIGRVFVVRLDAGENPDAVLPALAAERKIRVAHVILENGRAAILAPDAEGKPSLGWVDGGGGVVAPGGAVLPGEAVVWEIVGAPVTRVRDRMTGRMRLEPNAPPPASKTVVIPKPAAPPVPAAVAGPGTVPVYLFNAELN